MSLAATVKAMTAAGCSAEQITAVVCAYEAEATAAEEAKRASRREGNARRQAAWRQRNANNAHNAVTTRDEALSSVTERDETLPLSPPMINNSTPLNPQPEIIRERATPRSELSEALGNDLAAEVVDHRKRMGRPLTPGAAKRLAKQFLATGAPREAAQMMIDRAWQGFKAEWFENACQPRAGPNGSLPKTNMQIEALKASQRDANNGIEYDTSSF